MSRTLVQNTEISRCRPEINRWKGHYLKSLVFGEPYAHNMPYFWQILSSFQIYIKGLEAKGPFLCLGLQVSIKRAYQIPVRYSFL